MTNNTAVNRIVDCDNYPLHKPDGERFRAVVKWVRNRLHDDGCCVLKHFVRSDALEQLGQQCAEVAPNGYFTKQTVNVYNTTPKQVLPASHPANITFERGNAFVARDQIPRDHLISQLYSDRWFQDFIATCFETDTLHELADPLAGLCVNVLRPGCEHPWHFDTNEFSISLLTQPASEGGVFEYCPNIRSPEQENLQDVRDVISGDNVEKVRRLDLQCGDLQLFMGRYSLHRVTPVGGEQERHTAIFAYTRTPGVIGNPERTKQLFGRLLPEHKKVSNGRVRADQLLD